MGVIVPSDKRSYNIPKFRKSSKRKYAEGSTANFYNMQKISANDKRVGK